MWKRLVSKMFYKWVLKKCDLKNKINLKPQQMKKQFLITKIGKHLFYQMLCVVLLSSCDKKIPQNPFYIMQKDGSNYLTTKYTLVDKNGYQFEIIEQERHNVGDTIR